MRIEIEQVMVCPRCGTENLEPLINPVTRQPNGMYFCMDCFLTFDESQAEYKAKITEVIETDENG